MKRKIGVFGGTFDPVHLGHLIMAEQCREQGGLEQVWFIPAFRPPHKQDQPLAPFAQRVEMLALAIAGMPAFRVDELEKDRAGPSYTADTLEELQRRHLDAEFFLLIGADCLPDLAHWRDPLRIIERVGFLVFGRPDWPVLAVDQIQAILQLPPNTTLRLQAVHGPLIGISSRDLRRRIQESKSLRYLVPRAVECFIHDKRLYLGHNG